MHTSPPPPPPLCVERQAAYTTPSQPEPPPGSAHTWRKTGFVCFVCAAPTPGGFLRAGRRQKKGGQAGAAPQRPHRKKPLPKVCCICVYMGIPSEKNTGALVRVCAHCVPPRVCVCGDKNKTCARLAAEKKCGAAVCGLKQDLMARACVHVEAPRFDRGRPRPPGFVQCVIQKARMNTTAKKLSVKRPPQARSKGRAVLSACSVGRGFSLCGGEGPASVLGFFVCVVRGSNAVVAAAVKK